MYWQSMFLLCRISSSTLCHRVFSSRIVISRLNRSIFGKNCDIALYEFGREVATKNGNYETCDC